MSIIDRWKKAVRSLFRAADAETLCVEPGNIDDVVAQFQRRLGTTFRDPTLLGQALTHRSFLGGESEHLPASNERLEFLGDAVLELVVIEYLYGRYPGDREGELTQKKSLLVSKSVLFDRAENMDLGRFVFLSPAERDAGGAERSSILADAFEGVLGAIYLDQGISAARRFVERWLLDKSNEILGDTEKRNFKSMLQERVQAHLRIHPRYRVVSQEGPDHHKRFTVEVMIRGRVFGVGTGHNKKEAEQQAARQALVSGELSEWLVRGMDRRC